MAGVDLAADQPREPPVCVPLSARQVTPSLDPEEELSRPLQVLATSQRGEPE